MGTIKVLDCTLRDGGYCNEWKFGKKNAQKIVRGLVEAGIDIIECGFLTQDEPGGQGTTRFLQPQDVVSVLPKERCGKQFVCMINYGEYKAAGLPPWDGSSVDGIRVAFHKKDRAAALTLCGEIKAKGYKVFVQPMVSLSYSDRELLDMICQVNQMHLDAFYIVDSFGVMKRKDLIRLFYMVENNLREDIMLGYHSHNNMQLSYSNAQILVDTRTKHDVIIDSSVFGMGRGAGNLNTELFIEYLNDNIGTQYQMRPLLGIIDEIIYPLYQRNYWGYSLPNYLSARHNCHPNYARYLNAKHTLTVENMDAIFSTMADEKRAVYDEAYIEHLYSQYMAKDCTQENHLAELKLKIAGKTVLLIAPGRSSLEEKEKIISAAEDKNIVVISINFDYGACRTDHIFVSNLRRFRELDPNQRGKCIITSNIPETDVYLKTKYNELTNKWKAVSDNAGMMLIQYMIQLKAKRILLAGLDGYSTDPEQNFAEQNMNFYTRRTEFEAMNAGMQQALKEFSKIVEIRFVTKPRFIKI